MENFTNSIRKAITDENWFSALFLVLCMPDICGAIETPKEGNGVRYKRWFDANLGDYTSMFSAEDCWCFRCCCLHEGIDADMRMAYERIHFITPPPSGGSAHLNDLNGVLQMQIDIFCNNMADAVDKWDRDVAQKDSVMQLGVADLINIYEPESIEPFISFIPPQAENPSAPM